MLGLEEGPDLGLSVDGGCASWIGSPPENNSRAPVGLAQPASRHAAGEQTSRRAAKRPASRQAAGEQPSGRRGDRRGAGGWAKQPDDHGRSANRGFPADDRLEDCAANPAPSRCVPHCGTESSVTITTLSTVALWRVGRQQAIYRS
ncbi:hypothetical protein GCM10010166_10330 [Couchioplanes caeruleus subsp. azureus]|nr:hypothetical protein GCM10010166_10330 [Couchioplanes caeruleus subsp. azureus]